MLEIGYSVLICGAAGPGVLIQKGGRKLESRANSNRLNQIKDTTTTKHAEEPDALVLKAHHSPSYPIVLHKAKAIQARLSQPEAERP